MRVWIAVGVVCLVSGVACGASAQTDESESVSTPDDGAPASVEMSLSIAPTGLLALASLQFAGGATPGLGGLGLLQPTLDVGFTVDRNLLFVAGVSAQFSSNDGGPSSVAVALPLSLLWYLETPRVGHVMPMLRVGAQLAYDRSQAGVEVSETYLIGALARGGITWLADRCIGIRAELGLRGFASVWTAQNEIGGLIGLDALVGVVIRV